MWGLSRNRNQGGDRPFSKDSQGASMRFTPSHACTHGLYTRCMHAFAASRGRPCPAWTTLCHLDDLRRLPGGTSDCKKPGQGVKGAPGAATAAVKPQASWPMREG